MIVIKIILWVILALLLLIAFALIIPVRFCFEYSGAFNFTVKYLFLSFRLSPQDEKKSKKISKKKSRKKASKKKTANKSKKDKASENKNDSFIKQIKDMYKQKGLNGITTLIKELSKLIVDTLKPIFKRITLRRLNISIDVSSDNAADTAVNYGYTCAAVYPALSLILNTVKFKDYSVDIAPNFDKKESTISLYAEISIIPWFGVFYAVGALIKFIKLKIKGIL